MAYNHASTSVTLLQVLELTEPEKGLILCGIAPQSLEIIGLVKGITQSDELSFNISITDESIADRDECVVVAFDFADCTSHIIDKLMATTIAEPSTDSIDKRDPKSMSEAQKFNDEDLQGLQERPQPNSEKNFSEIGRNFSLTGSELSNRKLGSSEPTGRVESLNSKMIEASPSLPRLQFKTGEWIRCLGIAKLINDDKVRFFARSIDKMNDSSEIENHHKKVIADYKSIAQLQNPTSAMEGPQSNLMVVSSVPPQRQSSPNPILGESNHSLPRLAQSVNKLKHALLADEGEFISDVRKKRIKLDENLFQLEARAIHNSCNSGGNGCINDDLSSTPKTLGCLNYNQRLVLSIMKTRPQGSSTQELALELKNRLSLNCIQATLLSLAENGLCWSDDDEGKWWLVD